MNATENNIAQQPLARFFLAVTRYPRVFSVVGIVLIALFLAGLTNLVKDTSVDAFIPPDHPSIVANQKAKEVFALDDAIAVALLTDQTVFEQRTLEYISELHQAIAGLSNVNEARVTSIASESYIRGLEGRIDVGSYLDLSTVRERRQQWQQMPPHQATIVSADEQGAIILVELHEQKLAGETYTAIRELTRGAPSGVDIHIAGQGAVGGYLSKFIDEDSRTLQPLVFLVVCSVLFLAFRTVAAIGLPLLVIVGSAAGALAIMAWFGIPYFAITSALPVILVAIAVADSIHILTAYYVRRAANPAKDARGLVVDTMVEMSRPISLTTITTMAGFTGIALAEIMPPAVYFAIFATSGVFLAWLYSLIVLPCIMVLVGPKSSTAFREWQSNGADWSARLFTLIGSNAARKPISTMFMLGLVVTLALYGASQLRVDRALVEGFKATEDIRIADEIINQSFAGTAFLDVMIESTEEEGLLRASNMLRIRELQNYMETLPGVHKSISIVDYLSLLHQAMEPGTTTAGDRPLPIEGANDSAGRGGDNAIAQYFLVYDASGDPSDFDDEIDRFREKALLRGVLNTRYFSEEREAVEALNSYLTQTFNTPTLTGTLTGRVNVRYHWMVALGQHHIAGAVLSLVLVFLLASLIFRSMSAGLISVLPVSATLLCLYGVMGYTGVYLEPATTMFAGISLGVGVDFAIHLVARLRNALSGGAESVVVALEAVMPETARACFFNALALGAGFTVLLASELLTLKRFGGMVSLAAFVSFAMALVIVPAAYGLRERLSGKPGAVDFPLSGSR